MNDVLRLKVMPDYHCSAIWWDGDLTRLGLVELEELELSPELTADFDAWAKEFTATFHDENPVRFEWPSDEAEARHFERGMELARRLKTELGDRAVIRYWPSRTGGLLVEAP